MNKPNQRIGAVSNAHVGTDFESVAQKFFAQQKIVLNRAFSLEIGVGSEKKLHAFDLGSLPQQIVVECKSHRWTIGGRVPSAKMAVWNEAMYYFHLAPAQMKKVLFVLHDRRERSGESLLAYYKRTYSHLIPAKVDFLEWDEESGDILRV